MSVKPVSPNEVVQGGFPDFVLESFNLLIAQNFCGSSAKVEQEQVIDRILALANWGSGFNVNRKEIFDNGWLNIEEIYRKEGWQVEYFKPCYRGGDNFKAYFKFTKQ